MNVTIPDRVWVQLATIADKRGVKVDALVYAAVQSILNPPKRPRRFVSPIPDPKLRSMIRDRREMHWSVAQICDDMGLEARRVSATLQDLGFTTKRGRPRTTTKETAA